MVVRGRLHQLLLKEGSVITLVSHGALDPIMDDDWMLPDLGGRVNVMARGDGELYCFGIPQVWWHTVRGEWELINPEIIPSVEEML